MVMTKNRCEKSNEKVFQLQMRNDGWLRPGWWQQGGNEIIVSGIYQALTMCIVLRVTSLRNRYYYCPSKGTTEDEMARWHHRLN